MSSRRAAAILLVLMTSTVLIVGVSIIARVYTTRAIASHQNHDLILCDQILSSAQESIRYWLEHQASTVVVDPVLGAPIVSCVDDSLGIEGLGTRVLISAWDQQGMWPENWAEIGLDPPAIADSVGGAVHHLGQFDSESRLYPDHLKPSMFGGVVATHNPWPARSGRTRSRGIASINVNTAPEMLINQLFAQFDLGNLDEIIEQRKRGKFIAMSQSARNQVGEEIMLVSVSRVWSFRTQVTVNQVTRSLWCVYANQGGQWQLVQRTVIGESSHE